MGMSIDFISKKVRERSEGWFVLTGGLGCVRARRGPWTVRAIIKRPCSSSMHVIFECMVMAASLLLRQ